MREKQRHLDVCASGDPCAHLGAALAPARASSGAPGTWTRVAAAGDVPPNAMKAFSAAGVTVLVARSGDDFFAVQSLCPHEAVPLVLGEMAGATLTCLEHLWQFDLRTGAPLGEALEGLRTYPLKNEDGQLYICV